MATIAHCLYCFEVLAAKLENRDAMTLSELEASWDEYPNKKDVETENKMMDQVDRELDQLEDNDDDEDGEDDEEEEEEEEHAEPESNKRPKISSSLQKAKQLSSTSTSTGSSTPSSTSTTSTSAKSTSNNPTTTTSTTTTTTTTTTTPASSTTSVPRTSTTTKSKPLPTPTITPPTETPLFVTWNKYTTASCTGTPHLRGCIGTFESLPLASGLSSYALTSALHDTRFNPISSVSELPRLQCAVTLLTDFEPVADPMDWEIGVHGLRISFVSGGRRFGATYLPDVAVEQGWSKEECIVSLMRKGGWLGRRERWREVDGLKVVRYQGRKVSVDYKEFTAFKEWVDGREKV